jgi:hypothetical protein
MNPDCGRPTSADSELVGVTLTVNGQKWSGAIDPRTSLLDLLREHMVAHRREEGLRSWSVRRLHGTSGWPTDPGLSNARGADG